jgi:hypothetical protein
LQQFSQTEAFFSLEPQCDPHDCAHLTDDDVAQEVRTLNQGGISMFRDGFYPDLEPESP